MILHKFDAPILIEKFEQHDKYRQKCLDIIEEQPFTDSNFGNLEYGESIAKTDWYVDSDVPRKYLELIYEDVYAHFNKCFLSLGLGTKKIMSVWFQQYYKNDFHSFHVHDSAIWSCVYYLELKENSPGTTFKNFFTGELFTPEVNEGDIIIFPSFISHTSLPNEGAYRKTVIAFNMI